MKIKHRITLWIVGAGLLTSLLFSGVVFFEMLEQPYDLLDSQMDHREDMLAEALQAKVTPEGLDALTRSALGLWVRIFDASGHVIGQSVLARQVDLPLRRRKGGYTVRRDLPANQMEDLARYLDDDLGPSDNPAMNHKNQASLLRSSPATARWMSRTVSGMP